MLIHRFRLLIVLSIVIAACGSAQTTRPTNTPLTLPTRTPIVVSRPQATQSPAGTAIRLPAPRPTVTPASTATVTQPPASSPSSRPGVTPSATGALSRDAAPEVIRAALKAYGIDSNVYWFTIGGEQQFMLQYASPIRDRPGYAEMLGTVKAVAAQGFLRIEPPLYTLWIAATDLTGTSDTVLRLRRNTVERWARGEIGDADFYNNGFEPARIVITCTASECTGANPTPYPTFPPFPFPPFPTPTP